MCGGLVRPAWIHRHPLTGSVPLLRRQKNKKNSLIFLLVISCVKKIPSQQPEVEDHIKYDRKTEKDGENANASEQGYKINFRTSRRQFYLADEIGRMLYDRYRIE